MLNCKYSLANKTPMKSLNKNKEDLKWQIQMI